MFKAMSIQQFASYGSSDAKISPHFSPKRFILSSMPLTNIKLKFQSFEIQRHK